MEWLVSAKNIGFSYYQKSLFNNINLEFSTHTLYYIKGENGCGKTTLLRILAGLIQSNQGAVSYNHQCLNSECFLFYLGHELAIKYYLTVNEQLVLGPNGFFNQKELPLLLEKWALSRYRYTLCRYLSAGQLKRLALVILILSQTTLWILDEPYNALDQQGCHLLKQFMQQHLTRGGCIILTSHQAPNVSNCLTEEYQLS